MIIVSNRVGLAAVAAALCALAIIGFMKIAKAAAVSRAASHVVRLSDERVDARIAPTRQHNVWIARRDHLAIGDERHPVG